MNAMHEALYSVFQETLSEIYDTVVGDPDSPLTFSDLAGLVRKEHAELENLSTLAASRAGDMATLLAENARLIAEVEAAADLIVMKHEPESYFARSHCDFCGEDLDEHAKTCKYSIRLTAYQQAHAARLTRADGDGQGVTA